MASDLQLHTREACENQNDTGSRLWDANEYRIGGASTFVATYMKRQAKPVFEPQRDGEPNVTHRYAFFQEEDPDTARNGSFGPLCPGCCDWGTWAQGEYFASNSNVRSRLGCVPLAPSRQRLCSTTC